MNQLKIKGVVSSLLLIVFAITAFTGIVMYFSPQRAFEKHNVKLIHTYLGFLMIALVIVHFYLNSKLWKSEITSKP